MRLSCPKCDSTYLSGPPPSGGFQYQCYDCEHPFNHPRTREWTEGEAWAAIEGRRVVSVHDNYGSLCLVLDNGVVVDLDLSVACGSHCYGGSASMSWDIRDAFDGEVPDPADPQSAQTIEASS